MTDYKQIRSLDDLDEAILRNTLKREIIKQEFIANQNEFTSYFTSPAPLAHLLGIEISQSFKSQTFTVLRSAVIIFSAFRGGMRVLRGIMSIWK
jgi:hypothetical protein